MGWIMRCLILNLLLAGLVSIMVIVNAMADNATTKSHALTLDIKAKYQASFTHLDYVNPSAPKGGAIRLFSIGSFDTFNPFIIKGNPAAGIGYLYETLM